MSDKYKTYAELKEEIEEYKRIEQEDLKAFNNYESILTELEEWLEEESKKSDLKGCSFEQTYLTGKWNAYNKSLNKIQELRKKYGE